MDATAYQDLIKLEIGAGLEGPDADALTANVSIVWNAYETKQYAPRMQYLYTKQHLLRILMGQLRPKINKTLGPQTRQMKQYIDNAQMLYDNTTKEIELLEKQSRDNRAPVVDVSTPQDDFATLYPNLPNPSNPKFRGDYYS